MKPIMHNQCKKEAKISTLFVFSKGGTKQNSKSLLTPVSVNLFMLFHMVSCILLSNVVLLTTTYFKESDCLLKNFQQLEIC